MYNEKFYLPHSTKCFICGEENEVGLKCRFYADSKGAVHLDGQIAKKYTGFADVIHGGIQSAVLDEAMGWCGFTQSASPALCFTRELTVKFKRNVPPNAPIHVTARLLEVRRGMYFTEGRILSEDNTLLTVATGVFVPIPKEAMAQVNNQLLFVDDGRTYLKKALDIMNPKATSKL
jgi:acyl-coenzyme A thioesterase PaaI-like protein